jgi:hypothetical protein
MTDRRKISTANLYQIRVEESNGDVIAGPARPPSGRNQQFASFSYRKTAYTVKTLQDRRKMLLEHKEETMITLSTGDVPCGLGRPLAVEIDITL